MAGIGESLLLVTFCGLCTFLTSVSLSAIATNGAMKVSREIFLIIFWPYIVCILYDSRDKRKCYLIQEYFLNSCLALLVQSLTVRHPLLVVATEDINPEVISLVCILIY